MQAYLDLLKHVLENGTRKSNRTGVDTLSTFGYYYELDFSEKKEPDLSQHRYYLGDHFPLLTTKLVRWKSIVMELLWFISGSSNVEFLRRHGCKFWDPWADEKGNVAPGYGEAWRKFPGHKNTPSYTDEIGRFVVPQYPVHTYNDQLKWCIEELQRNPYTRRAVVSAWMPERAQNGQLPPCHYTYVFNVQNFEESIDTWANRYASQNKVLNGPLSIGEYPNSFYERWSKFAYRSFLDRKWIIDGHKSFMQLMQEENFLRQTEPRLCLHLTQRSGDCVLGIPFNTACYSLFLHLVAQFLNIKPGIFAHSIVDAHIYTSKSDGSMSEYDHVPGAKEQLLRQPFELPKLKLDPSIKSLQDLEKLCSPNVSTEEIMSKFQILNYQHHPEIKFKVAV